MKIRWIISAVLIAVAVVGISFADTWMKDTGYEINGTTLDFDIWQQLHNIGATTISATQWGYLGGQDQAVSTSDAPTFATINTGQGANELYAMNQDVQTTDTPTFAGLTLTDAITGLNYTINANSLQQNLTGFWGFEYGSGGTAYDSSREGNDGTLTNMDNSTCWVAGKDGTALEFDGVDDYVETQSSLSVSGNSVSVSVWVKDKGGTDGNVLSHKTTYFPYALWTNYANGGLAWLIGNSSDLYWLRTGDTPSISLNEWHNIVGTYDGTNQKLYLDGNLVAEQTIPAVDLSTTKLMRLGKTYFDSHYFNGSMDDVRIYNRALTEEEIRALYYGLGSQPTGHLSLK